LKTILLQDGILRRLWRQKQYYTAFLGGFAAMPLICGIIKRSIRFIGNKYKKRTDEAMDLIRSCYFSRRAKF